MVAIYAEVVSTSGVSSKNFLGRSNKALASSLVTAHPSYCLPLLVVVNH